MKTSWRPRNLNFASAYPAIALVSTTEKTQAAETRIELRKYRAKGTWLKTAEKLSRVGWRGQNVGGTAITSRSGLNADSVIHTSGSSISTAPAARAR